MYESAKIEKYEMEMLVLPTMGNRVFCSRSIDHLAMRQESSRREIAHYMRKYEEVA